MTEGAICRCEAISKDERLDVGQYRAICREWMIADKKYTDPLSERLREIYKAQYEEGDRMVKKKARADKRAYLEHLYVARQTEKAPDKVDHGELYRITKLLGKQRSKHGGPVRGKEGNLLTQGTGSTLGGSLKF